MTESPIGKLLQDYKFFSESVTKSVRATAFGVIAGIWAVFTADGISLGATGFFGLSTSALVTAAFIFSSGALLADILQYVAGLWMTNIGIERWQNLEDDQAEFFYDQDHLGFWGVVLYWTNFALFPVKVLAAIGGGVAFFFFAFAVAIDVNV